MITNFLKCISLIKYTLLSLILAINVIPALAQDYQIKFYAYAKQSKIYKEIEGKWKYERVADEHFYVLFEKRQVYEASYGYSADKIMAKYPFGWYKVKTNAFSVFTSYPLYAHAFSINEETYQRLKPDLLVYFFASFQESTTYANEILKAIGRNIPQLTDSTITPTEYVKEIIRLNTLNYQPFTDERDGNIYNTVKIGNQIWMAENLRFMADSLRILARSSETYGHFYDYKMASCACPSGWHLSTKEEWDTLIAIAGGIERASLNLKSADFWLYPEIGPKKVTTDSLGFRVLPVGSPPHFKDGHTWFWTSSQLHPGYIWTICFTFYNKEVIVKTTINGEGLDRWQSVRCVKDY